LNNLTETKEYMRIRWEFGEGIGEQFPEELFNKRIKDIALFDTLKNSVSNNVALNSSVKATGSKESVPLVTTPNWEGDILGFGRRCRSPDSSFSRGSRVVGGSDAGIFSNNAAFSGITNNAGNTAWDKREATSINGEDLSASAIKADGTLGGRFTNKNGWTTQNGKLPGFGAPVDMPKHLR
jgi:hypothetical protein